MRAAGSIALSVLACLLAFVSVFAVWTRSLVLDTDAYVRAVGPLIERPALRDELASRIVDELYAHVDVPRLLRDALPARADVLAPTLAQGIHDTSVQLASAALGTPAVRRVWEDANRVAHYQVVNVLEGKETVLTTNRGEVSIGLGSLAQQMRRALDADGVRVFDAVPASALDRRFVLFRSADLARAQRATRLLDDLGTWLPVATVIVAAGAIALARRRRRSAERLLLGLALTMVVVIICVALGRSYYLAHVGNGIPRPAAAVPFDGLVRSLRFWTRVLFGAAVLGWLVVWLAGARAVAPQERRMRLALFRVARAERRLLAGAGIVVAAIVLVGWDQPGPSVVASVGVALVLWELLLVALARAGPADLASA